MKVTLNGKEIKELRKEIVTDAFKQQLRKEIDRPFTNEMKEEIKRTTKRRLEGFNGDRLFEKVITKEISKRLDSSIDTKKITDNIELDIEEKANSIIAKLDIKSIANKISISAERKLLIKTLDELHTIERSLKMKLHMTDKLRGGK